MDTSNIRMVPLTDEEITEVQLTIVDRIIELNRDIKNGRVSAEKSTIEMETLTRVSNKVSQYSMKNR